jgi:small subunit ribosomal protein S1
MDALLEEQEYELEAPKRGEIRKGTIARVTESDILVDIGAKSEGIVSSQEFEQMSDSQREEFSIGTEVEVYVVRTGGTIILSLLRAEEEADWQNAEDLLKTEELVEGEVSGFNKGGLIIKLGLLRGFIPASQVSLARRRRANGDTPDERWGKMVGEPIASKVIEVDRRRNRLILSERAAAREARNAMKDRLITELRPGEIRAGHVISIADFGAFVDIGGADGLVHVSEMSWKRVENPRELLKVGQEVSVKVLDVDQERKRISLSLREMEDDPWTAIGEAYWEGQLVEGRITKLTKFGAFASLSGLEEYEIEGLIHISELADRHIIHPKEAVEEGQTVTLRVIKVDTDRRRIGLSLKRVDSPAYAEQDMKSAIAEIADEPDEVEDFDAELEEEVLEEELTPEADSEAQPDEAEAEPEEDDGDELEAELEEVAPELEEAEADETEAELEEVAPEPEEAEADETEAELEEEEAPAAEPAVDDELEASQTSLDQASPEEETAESEDSEAESGSDAPTEPGKEDSADQDVSDLDE